jgi:hypothetical protein
MCSKKRESKRDKNGNKKRLVSLGIGTCLVVLLFTSVFSHAAVPMDNNDPPYPPEFYYISGSATYADTTPADGAHVTVINERTSEELFDVVGPSGASGVSGEYLVDLFELPSLFEDGDTIRVHIEGTGSYSSWVGTNETIVDTNMVSQIVHVVLTSSINNPPGSPSNSAPSNGATGINLNPQLQVMVSDPDDDLLDVTFYDAQTDSVIGTVENIQSGNQATVVWSGLTPSSTYYWYVVASDSQLETESSVWSFTTQSIANRAPSQPTLISPLDMSTDVSRSPSLRVMVSDPDDDHLSVTFYDVTTGSIIGTVEDMESGTAQVTWTGRSYSTTYYWYVVASDSQLETQSGTWQFTTQAKPVTPTDRKPSSPQNLEASAGDSATDIYVTLSWSAPSDPGSTALTNYKIYRGSEPGKTTLQETVGNVLTYMDTGLEVNMTYYYRVSAVNSIGEGVRSSEISIITSDTTAPIISNAAVSPESFTKDDTITITVTVTDMSSIKRVHAIISVDGEEIDKVTLSSQGNNVYGGEWTAGDQDTYDVAVTASDIWDNQGNVEVGELNHKDEGGIPGFELVALLISFLVMLCALTVTRYLKKA